MTFGVCSYGIPEVRTFTREGGLRLRIGNYTSVANGALFLLGGNHPTDRLTTFPHRIRMDLADVGSDGFPRRSRDIVVGCDVWIGASTVILAGVNIGHGAVVAAGAVVVRDVEPFAIVAGNPARVVRFRFSENDRDLLLQLAWWDWDDEVVRDAVPILAEGDLMALEAFARERRLGID